MPDIFNFDSIDGIIISIVIIIQSLIFIYTGGIILRLARALPKFGDYGLAKVALSEEEAKTIGRDQLQERIDAEITSSPGSESAIDAELADPLSQQQIKRKDKPLEISVIEAHHSPSKPFKNILRATNTYLVRNKNLTADFPIMREVVDREIEGIQNQVESTIYLPLYLGLMGTIAGIIFGLGNDAFTSPDGSGMEVMQNIPVLLKGVSDAMWASFIGLFLTIVGSGFLYKMALGKMDRHRNDFFNFIQTELLPILSKDMTSNLSNLHANLNRFNKNFKNNLNSFSTSFQEVRNNLEAQSELLERLNAVNFTGISASLIEASDAIKGNNGSLEKLTQYQNELMNVAHASGSSIEKFQQLMGQFSAFDLDIKEILNRILGIYQGNQALLDYLQQHMGESQSREQLLKEHVQGLDGTVRDNIAKLHGSFIDSVELMDKEVEEAFTALKNYAIEQLDTIRQNYDTATPQFDKLAMLEHLGGIDSKLGQVDSQLVNLNSEVKSQTNALSSVNETSILTELSDLNSRIAQLVEVNEQILHNPGKVRIENPLKGTFTSLRRMLGLKPRQEPQALPSANQTTSQSIKRPVRIPRQHLNQTNNRAEVASEHPEVQKAASQLDLVVAKPSEKALINQSKRYFAIPSKDKLFYGAKLSDTLDVDLHIFELSLDHEKGEGTYTLINDDLVRSRAMRSRNAMIDPYMKVTGSGELGYIKVVQEGTVQKENNNWRIVELAQLEY